MVLERVSKEMFYLGILCLYKEHFKKTSRLHFPRDHSEVCISSTFIDICFFVHKHKWEVERFLPFLSIVSAARLIRLSDTVFKEESFFKKSCNILCCQYI